MSAVRFEEHNQRLKDRLQTAASMLAVCELICSLCVRQPRSGPQKWIPGTGDLATDALQPPAALARVERVRVTPSQL